MRDVFTFYWSIAGYKYTLVQWRCPGDATESVVCQTPCGELTKWSEWTNCSVLCDGGTQSRERYCVNKNLVVKAELCLNQELSQSRQCGTDRSGCKRYRFEIL